VSGLNAPVEFVQDPSSPSVQFVVEQGGRIRVIQNGVLLPTPFLDVSGAISSGGERGLLGLAFSPDYAVIAPFLHQLHRHEREHSRGPFQTVDRQSARRRIRRTRFDLRWNGGARFIEQPFANHNGGHLAFGPDLMLYVALGDGGAGDDPFNNAQRPGHAAWQTPPHQRARRRPGP
jgi:glucose/arabinose dehydrogenase